MGHEVTRAVARGMAAVGEEQRQRGGRQVVTTDGRQSQEIRSVEATQEQGRGAVATGQR